MSIFNSIGWGWVVAIVEACIVFSIWLSYRLHHKRLIKDLTEIAEIPPYCKVKEGPVAFYTEGGSNPSLMNLYVDMEDGVLEVNMIKRNMAVRNKGGVMHSIGGAKKWVKTKQ